MEWAVYWFPRAAITKYYKLGGLKQPFFSWVEMYSLTVLEARSPKSRCCQGYGLSEFSGDRSFLASPSFWQHNSYFYLCLHVAFSSCKDTSHTGLASTLTSCDVGCICKYHIPYRRPYSEVPGFRTSTYLFGEHNSTHNKLPLWE